MNKNITIKKIEVDAKVEFYFGENRIDILLRLPDYSGVPRQVEIRILGDYNNPSRTECKVYSYNAAMSDSGYNLTVDRIRRILFPELFPATATATADEDDCKI